MSHSHSDHRGVTRRQVLKGGLAAGALLAARPSFALATTANSDVEVTATRYSRLFRDTFVLHGDLHNHSHLSDGSGAPELAFASMRDSGLDVASLTDHSTLSWGPVGEVTEVACGLYDGEPEHGESADCRSLAGLDEDRWQRTNALADAADVPGVFTAIPGFEWSSPFLGHVNVWFSETWIDPLHTAGVDASGLGEHFRQVPGLGDILGPYLDLLLRNNPARTGMRPFYEWLAADPTTPVLGGGADGIASFNHPGREEGRFSYFDYDPRVAGQFVAMEILNRHEDYLFKSFGDGQPSPLVECLNAGWRVGLTGVSDEHGTDWGFPEGKGRTGLWVTEWSRGGVREALEARRVYATFIDGLRIDAAARSRPAGGGSPGWAGGSGSGKTRMGGGLTHSSGPVVFEVDVDRGPEWAGMEIEIQVLRPDEHVPKVVHVEPARIPTDGEPVISFTVDLDAADGDWVVLRIADPHALNPYAGPDDHPGNQRVLAYTSPFWLEAESDSALLSGLV
jgi:hypothetical protein